MAAAEVRTTCPYCGVGCGVLAKVAADGSVAVRGDPEHPANRGKLCSKGSALGETMGLGGRLLHPEIGGKPAAWDDCAGPRRRYLRRHHRPAWAGRGRLLRFRAAPDRGLLRRQQADEGVHRLGKHRYQFAAVHGLFRSRPPARVRRRYRSRRLRRLRMRRSGGADRLQYRLVPPDPLSATAGRPCRSEARRS